MECEFEGCDKPVRSKGYCMGHYAQYASGRTMKPLRSLRRLRRDEEGRVCTACDTYKPWSEFYRISPTSSTQYDGWRSACKVCSRKKEHANRLLRQARDEA